MSIIAVLEELEAQSDPQKRAFLPRFFKTGKGQYGEGDLFLGVIVPKMRLIAKKHRAICLDSIHQLLQNQFHEVRLCALLILVDRFKRADELDRKRIVDFYLSQTDRINNWDLVDLSASYILGEFLKDKSREILYSLAQSENLWEQRIAVVSTYALIKNQDFTDIIALSEQLLHHKHDLIHKATGWMLREMGKRDKQRLIDFLERFHQQMPRTMLRYSIEKFDEVERCYFMKRTV